MDNYLRLLEIPSKSFFLFGARGSGKSTWLRLKLPDAYTIDLLDESKFQEYLASPKSFAEEVLGIDKNRWVVIDEAQRLPNLLNEVHRMIERDQRKFVLCGSSARKLKKAGVNLLAGRATRRYMFPLLPQEMLNDFQLEFALQFGTLPLVVKSSDPSETLKDYVQLYLKEEIQAEAIVRNLPAFARFLPVSALFHGQVLNVSTLARDVGAHRNTVAGYIEVLEDTLLAFKVYAYQPKLKVREQQHSKFYFIDSGIVRGLKKQLGPVALEEKGSLFEGWICSLIRAYISYKDIADDMFYWAPSDSSFEVDFVLVKGNEKIAIESKSTASVSKNDLRGLTAIQNLDGLKKCILVYNGSSHRRTEDGIEIMPVKVFIETLEKGLF